MLRLTTAPGCSCATGPLRFDRHGWPAGSQTWFGSTWCSFPPFGRPVELPSSATVTFTLAPRSSRWQREGVSWSNRSGRSAQLSSCAGREAVRVLERRTQCAGTTGWRLRDGREVRSTVIAPCSNVGDGRLVDQPADPLATLGTSTITSSIRFGCRWGSGTWRGSVCRGFRCRRRPRTSSTLPSGTGRRVLRRWAAGSTSRVGH